MRRREEVRRWGEEGVGREEVKRTKATLQYRVEFLQIIR